MFSKFICTAFILLFCINCKAQLEAENNFAKQAEIMKADMLNKGFTLVDKDNGFISPSNAIAFEGLYNSGYTYVVIALVNDDYVDIKMHFWKIASQKKVAVTPKVRVNNGMTAAVYKFTQTNNINGRFDTFSQFNGNSYARVMLFRKRTN